MPTREDPTQLYIECIHKYDTQKYWKINITRTTTKKLWKKEK